MIIIRNKTSKQRMVNIAKPLNNTDSNGFSNTGSKKYVLYTHHIPNAHVMIIIHNVGNSVCYICDYMLHSRQILMKVIPCSPNKMDP